MVRIRGMLEEEPFGDTSSKITVNVLQDEVIEYGNFHCCLTIRSEMKSFQGLLFSLTMRLSSVSCRGTSIHCARQGNDMRVMQNSLSFMWGTLDVEINAPSAENPELPKVLSLM